MRKGRKTTLMIKSLLTGLLSCILLSPAFGQGGFFKLGAHGGVNVNKISGNSYKSGFSYNYMLGGYLQFNLGSRFGIQPEVNFMQGSAEFSNDASDIYDDLFRDGSQKKAKFSQLEVPVFVNIGIGQGNIVKLQLGPAYNGLLKQTVDSLKANNNIFKKNSFSAIGGLLIQLPVLNFGARYKMGMSDINAIDNRQSWKNQGFQVFVGIGL